MKSPAYEQSEPGFPRCSSCVVVFVLPWTCWSVAGGERWFTTIDPGSWGSHWLYRSTQYTW